MWLLGGILVCVVELLGGILVWVVGWDFGVGCWVGFWCGLLVGFGGLLVVGRF